MANPAPVRTQLQELHQHIYDLLCAVNTMPQQGAQPLGLTVQSAYPLAVYNVAFLVRCALGINPSPFNIDITATSQWDDHGVIVSQRVALVVSTPRPGPNGGIGPTILAQKTMLPGEDLTVALEVEVGKIIDGIQGGLPNAQV